MPYPFPGMNPWLENIKLWSGVHTRLINALADSLSGQLEPRYFVDVETHTYIGQPSNDEPLIRYPDLTILSHGGSPIAISPTYATTMPMEVELPHETIEEAYLSVRLIPKGEVVTVIELLSHTNKCAGVERASYLKKRRLFLASNVNFVEIDLLRSWAAMPNMEKAEEHDYRIFIRRREQRHKAQIYPFNVRDPIPIFPLPLQPDDDEPMVDLGALVQQVYDRARYKLIIDYTKPPDPLLRKTDRAWAEDCLKRL